MYRPHWHLDRKRGKECKEKVGLRRLSQRQLVPCQQIKTAARCGVQVNQGNEHQQRTQQRVQKELERRVDFVGTAPDANDEVHRYQGGFKEDIKQHTIQRTKDTDHETAQDQESAHVLVHPPRNDFPTGDHHNDIDKRRQQDEPHRDAINPEVVIDVEAFNPWCFFHKLHGRSGYIKLCIKR